MQNKKVFIDSLPILAKMLCESAGVGFTMGGNTAFCDGKKINLPLLPDDQDAIALARGYLDHECGHMIYSGDPATRYRKNAHLFNNILNILEDIYIEKSMWVKFPGSKKNLAILTRKIISRGEGFSLENDERGINLIIKYIMFRLRFLVLQQRAFEQLYTKASALIDADFGQAFVSGLDSIIDKVTRSTCSNHNVRIADEVIEYLKDQQKEEDSDDSGQGQDSGSDSDSDDSGQGQDSGSDSDSDDSGQGQDSGSDSDSDDSGQGQDSGSDSDSDDSGQSQDSGSDGSNTSSRDLRSKLSQVFEDAEDGNIEDLDLSKAVESALQELSLSEHISSDNIVPFSKSPQPFDITRKPERQKIKRETASLRSRLTGLLQAKTLQRSHFKSSGNRISSSKIHRVAANDSRVFEARDIRRGKSTAVQMVLDVSQSMNYKQRILIASDACFALALALESCNIPCDVCAFPAYEIRNRHNAGVFRILPFGKKMKTFEGNFGIDADGPETPLGEAIMWAKTNLLARKEDRKIMIVITDGEPCYYYEEDHALSAKDFALKAITLSEKSGIEMFGVGIGLDSISKFFKHNIVINDIASFPQQLFQLLQKHI
jgi:nitric oxide reductase activation protein